jgi:hypothetical protein
VILTGSSAFAAARELVLDVQSVPNAWAETRFDQKLQSELSRNPDLRLRLATTDPNGALILPGNRIDQDSLMDWGIEVGGRYLLIVTIDEYSLRRRKGFNLPLFFHKWETVATISGEYRFLDLQKQRLLEAKPFSEEMTGSQRFQGEMDDNRNDPTLHMTALDKTILFGRLEDQVVTLLTKRVKKLTRGR